MKYLSLIQALCLLQDKTLFSKPSSNGESPIEIMQKTKENLEAAEKLARQALKL